MKPADRAATKQGQVLKGQDDRWYKSVLRPATNRWFWKLEAESGEPKQEERKAIQSESPRKRRATVKAQPRVAFVSELKLGKKLGEGAFGSVFAVKGKDLVGKVAKGAENTLEQECEAMRRAAALNILPHCYGLQKGVLFMQRLEGPDLTCKDLTQGEVIDRLIEIARLAASLAIDVSDFHVFNYMWHKGTVLRIDAKHVRPPSWVVEPGVRPLALYAVNLRFYPLRIQEYLYTPACRDKHKRLWYLQLAAAYEFGLADYAQLLQTEALSGLLDEVLDAYAEAGLKPRQGSGKTRDPQDAVFQRFKPEILAQQKRVDVRAAGADLLAADDFLDALREFRSWFPDGGAAEAILEEEDDEDRAISTAITASFARRREEKTPLHLVWRENCRVAKPDAPKLIAFETAVRLLFPGELYGAARPNLSRPLVAAGLPRNGEMEILLLSMSRSILAPELESDADLLQPFFEQLGMPDWKALVSKYYALLTKLLS